MKVFTIAPEVNAIAGASVDDPFFRIMLSLEPHCRQFACTSKFADNHRDLIDFLNQNKVRIRLDAFDQLGPATVVYTGIEQKVSPNKIYQKLREKGVQFLYYWDHTEEMGFPPQKGEFFLYTSETQLFCCLYPGQYSMVDGAVEARLSPHGGQGAAVGVVRSSPLKSPSERSVMRARLEEELGVKFNPDLPLVTHFMHHQLDAVSVARGLSALSHQANIVIKDLDWHGMDLGNYRDYIQGPNIYSCARHSEELKNLIRFSADFLLTSCFSASTCTSLMMDLRIIPVYTQKCLPQL